LNTLKLSKRWLKKLKFDWLPTTFLRFFSNNFEKLDSSKTGKISSNIENLFIDINTKVKEMLQK
jgi:hypothetical protein